MATKDVKFTMVMTTDERRKLDTLSKKGMSGTPVSAATVLRVFINREYERQHEETPHRKMHRNSGKRSSKNV